MVTPTGYIAGEMGQAKAAIEKEISKLYQEKYRYCTGYEYTISRLKLELTSGNRFVYSPEKLAAMETDLASAIHSLEKPKAPIEKKIDDLAKTLLDLSKLTEQTIKAVPIMQCIPDPILSIISGYLD